MPEHPLSAVIPHFDRASYHAGITAAFAEIVAMGCKQLALSPAYTPDELVTMLPITLQIVAHHGLVMLVEPDLLVTPLFPADIAVGLTVILIAREQEALDVYGALKAMHTRSAAAGQLAVVAQELAWRFGRLLSYDDVAIQHLLDTQHTRHSGQAPEEPGAPPQQ